MANKKIVKAKVIDYPKDHLDHELVNPPSWWKSTQQARKAAATPALAEGECAAEETCPKTEEVMSVSTSDTFWFSSHIIPLGDLLMGVVALGGWGYGLHEQQKSDNSLQPAVPPVPPVFNLAPPEFDFANDGQPHVEDQGDGVIIKIDPEQIIALDISEILEDQGLAEHENWVTNGFEQEMAKNTGPEMFFYSGGEELIILPTESVVDVVI